jgi:predicted RNase H-like nuclease (RuvC/YqgF family)
MTTELIAARAEIEKLRAERDALQKSIDQECEDCGLWKQNDARGQEIERLRTEVERMTDVLDKTARECAEEEIRLGSCINDMNNDNRELRAECERLRDAMREAQTLCANDRGGKHDISDPSRPRGQGEGMTPRSAAVES